MSIGNGPVATSRDPIVDIAAAPTDGASDTDGRGYSPGTAESPDRSPTQAEKLGDLVDGEQEWLARYDIFFGHRLN
jgi:hypothetical protein